MSLLLVNWIKIWFCRYLLKHNQYDGLDAVLEAYSNLFYIFKCAIFIAGNLDLDDDGIAAVREAKIITNIEVNEDGEVIIATFDAESEDNPNVVKFTPEIKTNITNPLNGETVSVSIYPFQIQINLGKLFSNITV